MKNLKPGFDLGKELLKKHKHGQKKYGAFSFLNDGRNMKLEAADELVDAINYLVYEGIKGFYGEEALRKMSVKHFNDIYEECIIDVVVGHSTPLINAHTKLISRLNK